jgi:lipoate-protein ligase A
MSRTLDLEKEDNSQKDGTVFGDYRIGLFGYGVFSAAKNMAIDETLLNLSSTKKEFFIRFYDVDKPSVILAAYDHPDLARAGAAQNYAVSRRITGGRPIYIDNNTLEYMISGPLDGSRSEFEAISDIHLKFSRFLKEAIADMVGSEYSISIGKTSSIRINGKPIAGHGIRIEKHAFLYHGIVVIDKWNLGLIEELMQISDGDRKEIETLPNLADLTELDNKISANAELKKRLIGLIMSKLPKQNLYYMNSYESGQTLESASKLSSEKYENPDWVFRKDPLLRRDVKFCILYEG